MGSSKKTRKFCPHGCGSRVTNIARHEANCRRLRITEIITQERIGELAKEWSRVGKKRKHSSHVTADMIPTEDDPGSRKPRRPRHLDSYETGDDTGMLGIGEDLPVLPPDTDDMAAIALCEDSSTTDSSTPLPTTTTPADEFNISRVFYGHAHAKALRRDEESQSSSVQRSTDNAGDENEEGSDHEVCDAMIHEENPKARSGESESSDWAGHVLKHPGDGAPRIIESDGAEWVCTEKRVGREADSEEDMRMVGRGAEEEDEDE
ncbi:hypothetical protein L198_06130 [Cryptococcus wingfieldii CBS 7118]|uniref:Uncharacterized protein n=1 Tax=Cryptococcus wingfieldii CBS 7118 TaxID=1295528 RepID=A0A1E3IQD4_9TREE|nr:hypothetical protein L198_06130 [Cryptococcus wingfieldii CBS 7118]ODN90813.1 hypothetical protein L198_06130 [Cryptococcus wingfieldii CBS 7118]